MSERVVSGIQPTGEVQLGNYLGALREWVADQASYDSFFFIVDLHALTVAHDPNKIREATISGAAMLLACGIDPEIATVFVQSHVPAHAQMSWVMECVATTGELSRMTQYKDKKGRSEEVKAGLFTYPALMAGDILLYDASYVPVGDDQVQHLELTRTLAQRFNARYGTTLVVPQPKLAKTATRVMDLANPLAKMSKSSVSDAGRISLTDAPEVIEKKVRRAQTDAFGEVVYEPGNRERAGINNLLEILGAFGDEDPAVVAKRYNSYGSLKGDLADVLVDRISTIQAKYSDYLADPSQLEAILALGAQRAREVADATLRRVYDALGLLAAKRG